MNSSMIWKRVGNPFGGYDVVKGMAVDGTGVYIMGYDMRLGDPRWRMEKRHP